MKPPVLIADMILPHPVGPPIPSRPWQAPAYGLRLAIRRSNTLATPGSVIAVHYSRANRRTAAVFMFDAEDGQVENAAIQMLTDR